jgi:arylsulfatase A-like enzyme
VDIFGPWPDKPQYLEKTSSWQQGPDGKPYRQKKKLKASNFNTNTAGQGYQDWVEQYNECVMAIDEGVGRLIETLRQTGQLENTLIVYAADQGFALGQHGMNNKVAPYDAAMASPLIVSHPATLPVDAVCSQPVNAPDIVRFFCTTAGVDVPWRTDGRDIRPLLADPETAQWDQPMIMTHTGRCYGSDTDSQPDKAALYQVGNIPWYVMLRDGKYKYVRYLVEGEVEEIYNLDADPEELSNLAIQADFQSLLLSLRKKAIIELRRTHAGFVDTMPKTAAMKRGG